MFFFVPELNLLRNVDANNSESGVAAKSSSLLSGFRGSSSYNHETETIFALPKMQLQFKSIHVQDPEEPSLGGTILFHFICRHMCYIIIEKLQLQEFVLLFNKNNISMGLTSREHTH